MIRRRALALLAQAAGVSLMMPAGALAQEPRIGVVKSVTGTVTINRSGDRQAAASGDPVFLADSVETGASSTASIVLLDGTRLAMGPQSELWLDNFAYEPQNELLGIALRVLRGTMLFVTGEIGRLAPESIEVKTPTGTLGVRGTRFVVRTGR